MSTHSSGTETIAVSRWRGGLRRASVPASAITALLLLLVAELLSRTHVFPAHEMPPPSTVVRAGWHELGNSLFWQSVAHTMSAWGIGLGIATVAAVPVGIAIGMQPLLYRSVKVIIEFFRPIPGITILPLLVLVFGLTKTTEIVLVALGAFWPLLYQVVYGVRDIDPLTLDVAKVYRMHRRHRFTRIILPSATPYLATGLRLSAAIALIVAIGTEMIVGSHGLGNMIYGSQYGTTIPTMYALIAVSGVIGVAINVMFRRMERVTLHWHPAQRRVEWH